MLNLNAGDIGNSLKFESTVMRGLMINHTIFAFVSDIKYRKLLENDYNEIANNIEACCYKSATTLSGSLIEALLTDFLLDKGILSITKASSSSSIKTEEAGLNNLIEYCNSKKMISTRVYYLLQAIRDFRNLIHPAKAVRIGMEEIKKEDAILYQSTLNIILKEISKKRQKELGSTAEQLLNFLIYDDYGVELFDHMVKNANSEEERKNYLIIEVPKQLLHDSSELSNYYDFEGECLVGSFEEAQEHNDLEKQINKISESYHICFSASSEETQKLAVKKIVDVLKYGKNLEKNTYIKLFKVDYFNLVDSNDNNFLADYLALHARELKEIELNKFLIEVSPYINFVNRNKVFETAVFGIKNKNYREINDGLCKFIKDISASDKIQYKKMIERLGSLIIDNSDPDIIDFNNLISDILTKLGETVPFYCPF